MPPQIPGDAVRAPASLTAPAIVGFVELTGGRRCDRDRALEIAGCDGVRHTRAVQDVVRTDLRGNVFPDVIGRQLVARRRGTGDEQAGVGVGWRGPVAVRSAAHPVVAEHEVVGRKPRTVGRRQLAAVDEVARDLWRVGGAELVAQNDLAERRTLRGLGAQPILDGLDDRDVVPDIGGLDRVTHREARRAHVRAAGERRIATHPLVAHVLDARAVPAARRGGQLLIGDLVSHDLRQGGVLGRLRRDLSGRRALGGGGRGVDRGGDLHADLVPRRRIAGVGDVIGRQRVGGTRRTGDGGAVRSRSRRSEPTGTRTRGWPACCPTRCWSMPESTAPARR